MKLDTVVIIIKGLCYVLVGAFTPWSAALAQWVNSDQWPARIVWVGVILPASFVGGGSALLAFLNGSFDTYNKQKKADDTGVAIVTEVKPTPPKVATTV